MNPLSGVLGEAWQMYRKFAVHLLAIAFVIYLVTAVAAALLSLLGFFGALLGSILELFAAFLLQAALVKAVQDVRDGRADLSLSETVEASTPYLWAVAGASILVGIAITIRLMLAHRPRPVYLIHRLGRDSAGHRHRTVPACSRRSAAATSLSGATGGTFSARLS